MRAVVIIIIIIIIINVVIVIVVALVLVLVLVWKLSQLSHFGCLCFCAYFVTDPALISLRVKKLKFTALN
jgi:hypothetical protein